MSFRLGITRKRVYELIGSPPLVGADQHIIKHLTNLLEARGHIDIADLYRELYELESGWNSLKKFYYWCKDNEFSDEDLFVIEIYVKMARKYNCRCIKISAFAGRGAKLVHNLIDWAGECGQTTEELVSDYFNACLGEAAKFQKVIIGSPKSLLEHYGWSLFEEWVEKQGGRDSYIKLTKKEEMRILSERNMLLRLNDLQRQCMLDRNIEDYDRIGMDTVRLGISQTYRKWIK